MICSNYHSTKTDPDCPVCIIQMLIRALEAKDEHAPELTPAIMFLKRAERAERDARIAAGMR